jgi:hypothetical protein
MDDRDTAAPATTVDYIGRVALVASSLKSGLEKVCVGAVALRACCRTALLSWRRASLSLQKLLYAVLRMAVEDGSPDLLHCVSALLPCPLCTNFTHSRHVCSREVRRWWCSWTSSAQ